MRAIVGNRELNLLIGDITMENADVIVSSTNRRLLTGSGVDGAIHDKAGPTVKDYLVAKHPDGCPPGSAVITLAGLLSARYVVHAVTPQWEDGEEDEAELLAGAYHRSLELAAEHECHSIAFPAVGTGSHKYPIEDVARISLETIRDFDPDSDRPDDIRFVLSSKAIYDEFAQALRETEGYEIDA